MTLNQLPAYATSLMQMRQPAAMHQSADYQICKPATDGFDQEAEDSHAQAYAKALREAKLRRRRQPAAQPTPTCTTMPKPHRRGQCWQYAAAEEQRQPASKVYAQMPEGPLPDDIIEHLRDEALLVQLMILNQRHCATSPTSKALFSRLEQLQKVLKREVEHEAQRLRYRQPASDRCGNFVDELS